MKSLQRAQVPVSGTLLLALCVLCVAVNGVRLGQFTNRHARNAGHSTPLPNRTPASDLNTVFLEAESRTAANLRARLKISARAFAAVTTHQLDQDVMEGMGLPKTYRCRCMLHERTGERLVGTEALRNVRIRCTCLNRKYIPEVD